MNNFWPMIGLVAAAGCSPPGENTKDLTGGYELIKHDGLRQVIRSDGNITVDNVVEAHVEGASIRATVENGAVFVVDTQSGDVRMDSGEML